MFFFNINLFNNSLHNPTSDVINKMFSASFIPLINLQRALQKIVLHLLTLFSLIWQITPINILTEYYPLISENHFPIFHIPTNVMLQNIDTKVNNYRQINYHNNMQFLSTPTL